MDNYNEAAFNRKAAQYEHKWANYLTHTHGFLLNKIETSPEDRILDVSSGTGLLAHEMIDKNLPFKKLVLNDPSPKMQKFARERVGDHPHISFSKDTAEKLGFEESHFDTIICLNAFHFYTEQETVLNQFKRLLKTGGTLYMLDWNRSGYFRIVNRIIKWFTAENITTCSLVEIRNMLKACSFHIPDFKSWNWRYWKFFYIKAENS